MWAAVRALAAHRIAPRTVRIPPLSRYVRWNLNAAVQCTAQRDSNLKPTVTDGQQRQEVEDSHEGGRKEAGEGVIGLLLPEPMRACAISDVR
jgi:hypothetical protein